MTDDEHGIAGPPDYEDLEAEVVSLRSHLDEHDVLIAGLRADLELARRHIRRLLDAFASSDPDQFKARVEAVEFLSRTEHDVDRRIP